MSEPSSLAGWLAHCASLAESAAPATAARVASIRQRLGTASGAQIVCVTGTNGKSSTCAMLEAIALQAGYRVGLLGGKPLLRFEERCRVQGEAMSADAMLSHFVAVDQARQGVPIGFEEFVSLALFDALCKQALDLIVVEVTLGDSLAASQSIAANCAVITNIDLDPSQYPSHDRERVGFETAQIMRPGKPLVVSDPSPPAALLAHAESLDVELRRIGRDFNYAGDRQQWSWAGQAKRFNALAYPALRGVNQLLNASAALATFEALRDSLPMTAQAVRNGLAMVELPGRFQIVPGQPTLVLDVAHNDHAAATLVQNLDQMAFHPRTRAVFGSLRNHDLGALMRRLAPVVDTWHFTDLPAADSVPARELLELHQRLALQGPGPVTAHTHPNALQALAAAVEGADPADRIAAFGSVALVGAVLAQGLPRMPARHAN